MPGRYRRGPMAGRGSGNCARQGQGGKQRMFQEDAMQGAERTDFNASHRNSDIAIENKELIRQNEALRSELDAIKKRLDEMEGRTKN